MPRGRRAPTASRTPPTTTGPRPRPREPKRTGRPTAGAARGRRLRWRQPSPVRLAFVALRCDLARQAPQVDEPLGQCLVEAVAGVVRREAEVVQRVAAAAARDDRTTT